MLRLTWLLSIASLIMEAMNAECCRNFLDLSIHWLTFIA